MVYLCLPLTREVALSFGKDGGRDGLTVKLTTPQSASQTAPLTRGAENKHPLTPR